MLDKFPENLRTFETRLEFIKEVFSDLHPKEEIMASCIQHKLDRSFLDYVETLDLNVYKLTTFAKPEKVLKKME